MSEPRPSVVILAGPNGAGKSTAAPALLHDAFGIDEFVNADVIARGLSAFDPDRVASILGWHSQLLQPVPAACDNVGRLQHLWPSPCSRGRGLGVRDQRGLR